MWFSFPVLVLLLTGCSSFSSNLDKECFPVSFDHIFLKVPESSYSQIGKSDLFVNQNIGFFEPFKNPFGNHKGHYLTGESHYLEIFSKNSEAVEPLFGIGFYSDKKGCLDAIQKELTSLKKPFHLGSKEAWGQITEHKTPEEWVWVYEPTVSYVESEDLSKENYLIKLRTMNGDKKSNHYRFKEISNVSIVTSKNSQENLFNIFEKLGWKKSEDGSLTDGKTIVNIITRQSEKVIGVKHIVLRLNPKLTKAIDKKFDYVHFKGKDGRLSIEVP